MKLNQEQTAIIEGFLNRMELTQIDLRNEVLDHMAVSIENYLEKGFSFKEALDIVSEDWLPELRSHQSFWLGLLWQEPKILIDKAVDKTKITYLKSALVSIFTIGSFYALQSFLNVSMIKILNIIIGSVYIFLFLMLLYFSHRIKKTNFKTTFSFLFKINAIGFSFLLVLYNPLFSNIFGLIHDSAVSYVAIGMHGFTLAFCYFFLDFYKSHMNCQKYRIL